MFHFDDHGNQDCFFSILLFCCAQQSRLPSNFDSKIGRSFGQVSWVHHDLIRFKFSLGNYSVSKATQKLSKLNEWQHILHCITSNLTTTFPHLNEELRIQSNGCRHPQPNYDGKHFLVWAAHQRSNPTTTTDPERFQIKEWLIT